MAITLIVLALSAVFFVMGRIRSDIIALCALLVLLLSGILTPEEALAGFSSSVVIMMVGLFIVGGAVLQTGLAKTISSRIMSLAGKSELRLFLMVMIVTSCIGAFVSNTGTVALMLPIVVSLAAGAKMQAGRLLMPLAFASSMGGMLTLIGTPPNLVIQETLEKAGLPTLQFFSFFPVGVVCILVGIVVLLPLTKWLLTKDENEKNGDRRRGKTLTQLVNEYQLTDQLSRYHIDTASPLCGKTIADVDIHNRYGLTIMEVRHISGSQKSIIKSVSQSLAGPDTVLYEGNILYLAGGKEAAEQFAKDYRISPLADDGNTIDFYDIGIAELVMLPRSSLVNRKLKESGLRANYNINVIAIRRGADYIMNDLPEERLDSGDVLLVQGSWENIARLSHEEDDWVVLGQPLEEAARVTLDYKAPVAAGIMVLMVAMMVFDFIPVAPVTAVMLASVLMILTGCFRNVEAAYKTINWESVILIGAMMPMSVALQKTGASTMISHSLVSGLGEWGPTALLAGIYFTTSLLTMFISNTATAVLMAPIAMSAVGELGLNPLPFLFAVSVAASMCFASPFSTPPNALVMHAGGYTFMDYVKVGLPLQIIMGLVMIIVLPLIFPF